MTETKNPNIVATIALEDPIHYGLDEITELKIRKPTARDVIRVGNPVKIKSFDPLEIEFDEAKSFRMLSSLTSLPVEGTLESMSSNDAVSALYAIAPFFHTGLQDESGRPVNGHVIEAGRAVRQLAKIYQGNLQFLLELEIEEVWRLYDDTMADIEEERRRNAV